MPFEKQEAESQAEEYSNANEENLSNASILAFIMVKHSMHNSPLFCFFFIRNLDTHYNINNNNNDTKKKYCL